MLDAFEILLNPDQVIPYFQPIISADTQLIVGYEVLPYFTIEDQPVQNLKWFFDDSTIPDEFQSEMYNLVIEKALDYYLTTDQSAFLIFPYDIQFLFKDGGESFLQFLQSKEGLNLNKMVLQLKDDFLSEQMDSIQNLLNYLKLSGLKIAFSGIGENNGNLDRLVLLKPTIVKIDVSFLKGNELPHLYRNVHHSISLLSQKIGATLLFDGISSYHQFNHAWRNGGRYYQGHYFKKALPKFVETDSCKEQILKDFQIFVNYERKKIKAQLELTNQINEQFKSAISAFPANEAFDTIILKIGQACSSFAFRVYVCNDEGLQLSSNAELAPDGKWLLREESRNKNWSWRPYFFENIARMNVEKKGILSDLYTDIEREEQIRTFSYPLSSKLFIFLDISYNYLYEQDGLL